MKVTAPECPRIAAEYLEDERSAHEADHFGQEYMAEFTSCEGALFSRELVEAALDDEIEPV